MTHLAMFLAGVAAMALVKWMGITVHVLAEHKKQMDLQNEAIKELVDLTMGLDAWHDEVLGRKKASLMERMNENEREGGPQPEGDSEGDEGPGSNGSQPGSSGRWNGGPAGGVEGY